MGEMAHISGERSGSARHDPSLSPEEVNGFENLILLCPNHHTLIDEVEPDQHPVERLKEMKQTHETRSLSRSEWASDDDLDRYVGLVVAKQGLLLASDDQATLRRGRSLDFGLHGHTHE